eukprot:TRINITY_DN1215_c0_g1_i2.p1 TRINITY_DN1215_c0_g1~~TRINITY_DN1215_c0_g1_i2.p1  ORF type:complete len:258 (-),score=34.91 TRINITY_DN1215_c0_g1_i2:132-836(-)
MTRAFSKKQSNWLRFANLLKIRLFNEHPIIAPFYRDDYTNMTGMQRAMLLLVTMMGCMVIPAIVFGEVRNTAPIEVAVIFLTGFVATIPTLFLLWIFQYSKPLMQPQKEDFVRGNWQRSSDSDDPNARADDALMERQAKVLNPHSTAFLFLKHCNNKQEVSAEAVASGFEDTDRDAILQRSRKELASHQVSISWLAENYIKFLRVAERQFNNFDISKDKILRPAEMETVVRWFQ